MAITCGLINELKFISKSLRTPVASTIKCDKFMSEIQITIKEQVLEISYLGYRIWRESLDDAVTMFGVESASTIFKIMQKIDAHDKSWHNLKYIEK